MADISRDIQAACDRYVRQLDVLHDDYVHTRALWQALRVEIDRGGSGPTIANPTTQNVVNGFQLAAKAQDSLQRLMTRTFKEIVAQFEMFVAELLRIWLHNDPSLLSEKALNVNTLLACKTLAEAQDAAIREAVESTVMDRMYGRPEKWFVYLRRNLNVQVDGGDEAMFIEMKARRDSMEHNDGLVDAAYLEKAKSAGRYQPGDRVNLHEADVNEAHALTQRLILATAACASTAQKVRS